jgi:hypothetical protein
MGDSRFGGGGVQLNLMQQLELKNIISKTAEELWFETDRDIEKDAEYKKAFKDGVDAMEAALLATLT